MTATATIPPRRRSLAPRSLTGKLVLGVVALVLVVVVAAGLGTYFALRSFLYSRLDQQLSGVANGNVEQIDRCPSLAQCEPVTNGGLESPQVEYLAILNPDGSTAAIPRESRAVRSMQLSQSTGVSALSSKTTRTVTTSDGVELRVTVRPLLPPLDGYYLATGLSTDEVDRTLRRLVELDLLVGGLGCVVALVATLYGVRFSLRRLYGVTATAREVAAELSPEGAGLDRRVPVHDTDTEVGQLADSMNTLLSAVELQFAARLASEQRMRQFLADASHELRTPLTSIRGYAELARMQQAHAGTVAAGDDDPDNLQRIEGEGTRMSKLVDDLLLLARGDQGAERETGQVELIDLAEIVDEAVARVHAGYPGRELRVDVRPDLMVIGDPDQLLRALSNLITNAAVHTRPDLPIEVRGVRVGDTIEVVVRDRGPGLPPEEAAQVFDRFWRADKARSRARGGSGLGLSIVASLVAAHNGTVHFASTVPDGSTVTVRLPAATGAETDPA
jgi:two-component system OmpR family sensor kinase